MIMKFHRGRSLRADAQFQVGLVTLCLLLLSAAFGRADCVGEAEWQESVLVDRLRCGRPGYLTNLTYYFSEDVQIDQWKNLPGLGEAHSSERMMAIYQGGASNRCQSVRASCDAVSSNSWLVSIPFDASADLHANDGGNCDRIVSLPGGCECGGGQESGQPAIEDCHPLADCANVCRTAFNQLQMLCCDGTFYYPAPIASEETTALELTDSHSLKDVTTTYADGMGTLRQRQEAELGAPYTILEFAQEVLEEAAESDWWRGKFFLNSLIPDEDKRCLGAALLRYRIKFKSKLGVRYTARWSLLITQYSPTYSTNLLSGLSWSGVGDGQTLYSPWFYLPKPSLFEIMDGEVVDLQIESEGGCATGSCDAADDTPGDGPDFLGSARYLISLGAGSTEGLAGTIAFAAETPTAAMFTPAALEFRVDPAVVTVTTNPSGHIHLAAPVVLARIEPTNQHGYWIHCSARNTLGDGLGYLTNAPFLSHLILNPHGHAAVHTLQHIRFRPGLALTNEFTCEQASESVTRWRLVSGNRLKGETLELTRNSGGRTTKTSRVFDPASGEELSRRDEWFQSTLQGERLLAHVLDPAGLALGTTNTYDAQGRLLLSVREDGSWERREYDSRGWLLRRIRPFLDEQPSAPAELCHVLSFEYQSIPGSPDQADWHVGEPRTTTEHVLGKVVRKTMRAFSSEFSSQTRVVADPHAGWNAPEAEITESETDRDGRVTFVRRADGTSQRTWRNDFGSGRITTTELRDDAGLAYQTIEEHTDALGRMVSRQTLDVESGTVTERLQYSEPDEFGRPTRVTYLDGTSSMVLRESCCSVRRETDRDGVTTVYHHDALNRAADSTRAGVTISNVFNAAGQLLAQYRSAAGIRPSLIRGMKYDRAGRVAFETNALGGVWRHLYGLTETGGRREILVQPDGGEQVTAWHRSGKLAWRVGTAAYPMRYRYSVTNDDAHAYQTATEIRLDRDNRDTAEWTQALQDHEGRVIKTIFPGQPVPWEGARFNARGQLIEERDPDGFVTLFGYNSRGEREVICLDADRNGIIDQGGRDRFTRVLRRVTAAHGTIVHRVETFMAGTEDRSDLMSSKVVETSIDGSKTWQLDERGVRTSARTRLGDGSWSVVETEPDGTYSVHLFRLGQRIRSSAFGTDGTRLNSSTYGYDSLGRRSRVTDEHGSTVSYRFDAADNVVRATTLPPVGTEGRAGGELISYDRMNRPTNTVLADGSLVWRRYSPRGELVQMGGSQTIPVAYAFDSQGRRTHMTNWTEFRSESGVQVITWVYDPARGWLQQKRYPDGRGPSYGYTPAGRLEQRRWARGVSTFYRYDSVGELRQVNYDDGMTPAVSVERDRLGRPTIVRQGASVWRRDYDSAGRLLSEEVLAGPTAGWRTMAEWTPWGEKLQQRIGYGGTDLVSQRYSFDVAGRLASAESGATEVRYAYVPQSSQIERTTFRHAGEMRLATLRRYDTWERLESVVSTNEIVSADGTGALAFKYDYSDLSQRRQSTGGDGSFWRYDYDERGQVVGGRRFWNDGRPVAGQQFEYGYDDIANRQWTRVGGGEDGDGLRLSHYENDVLNRLVQREVPAVIDVLGVATATAADVSVNGVAALRQGEYFRALVPVSNQTTSVWHPVATRVTSQGRELASVGHVRVAPAIERHEYDADGNLIADGRWSYRWDAENRLVAIMTRDDALPESRVLVEFGYDSMGRRSWKSVRRWAGEDWGGAKEESYLYDGWNLVAVVDAPAGRLKGSFLWGGDLSGRRQGAGGVGGLLAVEAEGQTFFPAFDGNGNVVGLIEGARGDVVARYEYGPFGELIRQTGPAARMNPFRFSTKFHDDETGLIDYGRRLYCRERGRWINRDPIEEQGGLNPYVFVGNQPVSSVDYLGLARITRSGACDSPGTRLGTFSWKSPAVYNCSRVNGATKTYTHESSVSITLGFEAGNDGSGKFSLRVSTAHSEGETSQISLGCCAAAYWQYDFDCTCDPVGVWGWEFVIWERGMAPELFKGRVGCKLKSEGLREDEIKKYCPDCRK